MQNVRALRTPPARLRPFGSGSTVAALLVLLGLLFGVCPDARVARADDNGPGFYVVAHPDNPVDKVERRLLAGLFLKEVTRWKSGEAVRPADLKPDASVRKRFSEIVLNRSVAAVKRYWQQRIFSGRGVPPPELDSDEAVIAYVTKHRGGIGYVSSTAGIGKARLIRVE